MKRLLIICLLIISLEKISYSQEIKFRYFNETYNNLINADLYTESVRWKDDQSFLIPLPFIYKFGVVNSEFINVHTNGYFTYDNPSQDSSLTFFAFWLYDLIDRSYKIGSTVPQSMISYKTDIINNEKVAIVEFKNAGFKFGSANDSINFQVWAFESGNKIQVRFGKSYVQNWQPILSIDSPAVCILLNNQGTEIGGCLNGSTTNPTFDTVSGRFNTVPIDGTVYEFTYLTTNINYTKQKNDINYKLINNKLLLESNYLNAINRIELFDLLGRKLGFSNSNTIEIHSINQGVYVLKVFTNNGVIAKQIKIEH